MYRTITQLKIASVYKILGSFGILPRSIQIRSVNIFVDYYVNKNKCATNNSLTIAKKGVLKSLEKRLNDETNAGNPLRTMSRFYVRIPLCCLHLNHPVRESATMGWTRFTGSGKSQRYQCCRSQTMYAENEVFGELTGAKKAKKTNRSYYPSHKDLRNHTLARAISAQKYCDDDQESLRLKIRDWKQRSPQMRFFCRTRDDPPASSDPAGNNSSEESWFIFVHQDPWQQRLLERYGSQLVLMDSTYKTTMYAIPLFFICANVGYTVVAEFVSDGRPNFDKRTEEMKSCLLHGGLLFCRNRCN